MRRCWNLARRWKNDAVLLLDNLAAADEENKTIRDWSRDIPGFPGDIPVLELSMLDTPPPDAPNANAVSGASPGPAGRHGRLHPANAVYAGPDGVRLTSDDGFLNSIAVIDQRSAQLQQLKTLAAYATPLLLDDDGSSRQFAPFVLDILPGGRKTEANVSSPSYLDLPKKRRTPDANGPILVSFGGEDPAGLSLAMLSALVHDAGIAAERITIVLPASSAVDTAPQPPEAAGLPPEAPSLLPATSESQAASEPLIPPGVQQLQSPENLKDQLWKFGLVICSYGLTVWEALASGCAVLTVEPSAYHYSLSSSAGIPSAGFVSVVTDSRSGSAGSSSGSELPRQISHELVLQLKNSRKLNQAADKIAGLLSERQDLRQLLEQLEAPRPRCAACGHLLPPVIARFSDRSFYRCPSCLITGLYRFQRKANEYGESYFDEEYRAQYGRSYLEDWQAIKSLTVPRLKLIREKVPMGCRLLDIGCAYGVFLEAAAEAGFEPHGIDVSEEAVAYVREKLGIPAQAGHFPPKKPAQDAEQQAADRINESGDTGGPLTATTFDVITLWYVIEHFPRLDIVLETVSKMLAPGAVLAFSTPNGRGITGRRNYRGFLQNSPADHYSIWNPAVARKLLARYGMKVYRIRVTGHHPERFGISLRSNTILARVLRVVLGLVSRLFGLGDTFEVYAVKAPLKKHRFSREPIGETAKESSAV